MEGGLRQPPWKSRLTPKGPLTTHRLRGAASEVKFPVSKFWGYTHFTFCSLEMGSCYVAQPGPEPMGSSDPSASAFPTVVTADLLLHLLWGAAQSLAPCKVSCVPLSPLPLALPSTLFRMQLTLDLSLSPYISLHIPELYGIEPRSLPLAVVFFPDFQYSL